MVRHRVMFLPSERVFYAEGADTLLETAMRAGVHINASCGGGGGCGRCRVRIADGEGRSKPAPSISAADYEQGFRLACQTYPAGDMVVEVPFPSRIDDSTGIPLPGGTHLFAAEGFGGLLADREPDPPVFRKVLRLEAPTLQNNTADFDRLGRELRRACGIEPVSMGIEVLRDLGRVVRDGDWIVTATLAARDWGFEIINLEAGAREAGSFAVAVDVGTTTVCAELVGTHPGPAEETGRIAPQALTQSCRYNAQIRYGDDVISRIMFSRKRGALKRLQEALSETISEVVGEVLERAGVDPAGVTHLVMAGNTTMTHLLLGIDPRPIMLSPYTPAAISFPPLRAGDLGLRVNARAEVRFSPCVSSYVGGDIVAGILGSGMFRREKAALYVDIGTNGEIVLGQREWLMSASCSAGPAFEGGGILCGMRAAAGAIEQAQINPSTFEPMIMTIGKERPLGICGSGLIDLLGGLFRAGLIDERGKYRRERETERLRKGEYGMEYIVVEASATGHGLDIVLTEADIDNLMRTKAALFAGCRVLVDAAGLAFGDLDAVLIAGGFGRFIDPAKAMAIGLLPELPLERFMFVGNGSLLGAKLMTLSRSMAGEALKIAGAMANVELSTNNRFMEEFTAAMFLPHTDSGLFPSACSQERTVR